MNEQNDDVKLETPFQALRIDSKTSSTENVNIGFINDVIKRDYRAISFIGNDECLMIPYDLSVSAIIYDYKNKTTKCDDIEIKHNLNGSRKILDATDLEPDNTLWLLCVDENNHVSIVKAFFYTFRIFFMKEYIIPETFHNFSNYQAIVKVSNNNFILFSKFDYTSSLNANQRNASLFVIIKNHVINARPLIFSVNQGTHSEMTYNLGKITTAFNYGNAITVIPQVASAYAYRIYNINTREIPIIKKCIKNSKDIPLMNVNPVYSYYTNDIADYGKFLYLNGINAMTSNNNILYGISSWHIPYYVFKNETSPTDKLYVERLDSDTLPDKYDIRDAGLYIKPCI